MHHDAGRRALRGGDLRVLFYALLGVIVFHPVCPRIEPRRPGPEAIIIICNPADFETCNVEFFEFFGTSVDHGRSVYVVLLLHRFCFYIFLV